MANNRVLTAWDIVIIITYFILVLGVGLLSMFRSNRGTISGYFLAGRFMIWLPVGASIFASNIGSEHFVGLAGSGAAGGIGVAAFELNALVIVQILGWVFLPVYIACGASTLPEYIHKRFGGHRLRVYLACLSVLLYILTKISVNLYSGGLFIQQALGWNIYWAIILLLFLTGLVTVTGGLAAVIYTDTLQCAIMIIGGISLMIVGFVRVGGLVGLMEQYQHAIPDTTLYSNGSTYGTTCGIPRADAWQMLREPRHSDIPWAGFIFGQSVASLWYWCTDQMMVQRAMAAKSLSHAQGGTLLAGYLKILPMFMIVMPGMISRVLHPNIIACADPDVCEAACGSRIGCSNLAYPLLVLNLMPSAARGMMVACMIAALISDLTSIFNSSSTLFTIDIYPRIRHKPSIKELLIVGRVFVVIMVIISILWVPVLQTVQGGQLFTYIQVVSAHLSPPLAAMYTLSVLWKRLNEKGCFWGLVAGFVVGFIRMGLDFYYVEPECIDKFHNGDPRPAIVKNFHYMYFALLLFVITVVSSVVVSLLTEPLPQKYTVRTTYWTRFDTTQVEDVEHVDEAAGVQHNGEVIPMKPKDGGADVDKDNKKLTVTATYSRGICQKIWNWLIGLDYSPEGQKASEELRKHLHTLSSLEQDPKAKIFLNCMLVVVLCVAVFLYIFWSV